MKKVLNSHYTYLLAFCFGSLLFGFEISDVIKYGFPIQTPEFILAVSAIFCYAILSLYFFYGFVKIKKSKGSQ